MINVLTEKHFLILFFGCLYGSLVAQSYLGFNVDNDLYFGSDRYYSSGIFLEYGFHRKVKSDSTNHKYFISKHWTLGQEINTPSLHKTIDKKDMDYPYSGWLFLRFSKERYKNADFGVGWGVTFGVSGAEASLAKKMQNTYHILILNLEELSWSFSIPQAFHINAQTSFSSGIIIRQNIKFVQQSHLEFGTFRSGAKTRLGFQLGNLHGLPFFGHRLEKIMRGFALFAGTVLEYKYHDYSLTGSLFKDNSPFDFEMKRFTNNLQAGIMIHQNPWRFKLLFNSISKNISEQEYKRHPFLNITLSRVF